MKKLVSKLCNSDTQSKRTARPQAKGVDSSHQKVVIDRKDQTQALSQIYSSFKCAVLKQYTCILLCESLVLQCSLITCTCRGTTVPFRLCLEQNILLRTKLFIVQLEQQLVDYVVSIKCEVEQEEGPLAHIEEHIRFGIQVGDWIQHKISSLSSAVITTYPTTSHTSITITTTIIYHKLTQCQFTSDHQTVARAACHTVGSASSSSSSTGSRKRQRSSSSNEHRSGKATSAQQDLIKGLMFCDSMQTIYQNEDEGSGS